MRYSFLVIALAASVAVASAQSGEISLSGGVSRFGGVNIGSLTGAASDAVKEKDGFRLAARLTINSRSHMGHEFGYAYNRGGLSIPSQSDVSVPLHQAFYDFLLYATPEGSKIRPFVCGGVGFSSFFPPGTSVSYGNQTTKFGPNYGGGLKVKVAPMFGIRLDVRQYATPKPFDLVNQSGWMRQTEISAGVSFLL